MKAMLNRLGRIARRVLRVLAIGAGTLVALCITLVVLALVAVNLPPLRGVAVAKANDLLGDLFAGKVTIEAVKHLGVTGVRGVRARVSDRNGTQLLLVDDADVTVGTVSTLRSVLFGKGDIVVDIRGVRLGYVDACVDSDREGDLLLQKAFEPKEVKEGSPPGRGTTIHLRDVRLRHAWVHGQPKGAPLVDSEIDGVEVSALIGAKRMAVDLAKLQILARALPVNANPRLEIEAHYAAPSTTGRDKGGVVDIRGEIGTVPLSAHAALDGEDVDAFLDVPQITRDMMQTMVPAMSLTQNLSAHATARGRLSDVDANIAVKGGPGAVDLQAHLTATDDTTVRATLVAKHIDAHVFSEGAPVTDANLNANLDVTSRKNGTTDGKYVIEVPPGSVRSEPIPEARIAGALRVESDKSRGTETASLTGSGVVHEKGAPVSLDYELRRDGDDSSVRFDLHVPVKRLEQTRLGTGQGSIDLRAKGTVALGDTSFVDAELDLKGSGLRYAEYQMQRVWLRGHARGSAADPRIDLLFQGTGIAAQGMTFASAVLTTQGALRTPFVTVNVVPQDGPKLEAQAEIDVGDATTVRDLSVAVSRDDVRAQLSATEVRIGDGSLRVEGVLVEGLGDPLRAEATRTGNDFFVRAHTSELDLSRISRLLKTREVQEGRLAFDIDMRAQPTGARGHVRLDLQRAVFEKLKGAKIELEAKFDGLSVEAKANAQLGRFGALDLRQCRIALGKAGPLRAAGWRSARGEVDLDSQFDLSRVAEVVPPEMLPFDEMQGKVWLRANMARESATAPPGGEISVQTRGLLLTGKSEQEQVDGVRVVETPPWRMEGIDVELAANIDPEKGATALSTRLIDKTGPMLLVTGRAPTVPYAAWIAGKPVSRDQAMRLPFAVQATIPRRELKTLPAMLKTRNMTGDVAGQVTLEGTLAEPDFHASVESRRFGTQSNSALKPIDSNVDARYAKGKGVAQFDLGAEGRQLFGGTFEVNGKLEDLIAGHTDAPWEASARVKMNQFPMETVTRFTDLRVKGHASGELTVENLHKDARAKVSIALDQMAVGRAKFPRGNINVDYDGHRLRAGIRLDQPDGHAEVAAQLGMNWGKELAPHPVDTEPAVISLKANQLQAGALLPFLAGAMSELEGRIDADARLELGAGGNAPKMKGSIALKNARMQLSSVGEPFRDVSAKVVVAEDGTVRLEQATLRGSSGRLNASGMARLNGFKLTEANAKIQIPRREPLPLDVAGQDIGYVDGDIEIKATSANDDALQVNVEIPRLHANLPLSSAKKARELNEAESIKVGHFRGPNYFAVLPKDAVDLKEAVDPPEEKTKSTAETTIAIHLGDDVEIKRGTTLRVAFSGKPVIKLGDEVQMSGQIRLTRGMLEFQGKRFEIENGTVTFVGEEPGNPQIVVTARWKAPDSTLVYVDFKGPVKTGKVNLRSEPPRPKNEILSLIMFGTAEGSSSTPYAQKQPDGATRAGSFAAGFATEGISKGLDQLTGLEIAAKIDTTNAANPKPELEVQIARDVALKVGYVIGTPPPGTNPDKTLVTLDWRFLRRWTMDTTFGDQGSSIVDFVWRHRY